MTSQPISTISYNSLPFLQKVLDKLYKEHIIQCYQFICHKGEDGDKDHIHLRLEPNRRVDVMVLQALFREPVIGMDKPLGCRPFRPSKEEDWFLYAVHDEEYLKIKYGGFEKGEKLPYSWENIHTPADYDVEIAFIRAKAKLEHTSVNMAKKLSSGHEPMELILQGENVHTVMAINDAIYKNDYQRLRNAFDTLSREHKFLLELLDEIGFKFDDKGKVEVNFSKVTHYLRLQEEGKKKNV